MVSALASACGETGANLLTLGCDVTGIHVEGTSSSPPASGGFSPAGVGIYFSAITPAPSAPEFPAGMILLMAVAFPALLFVRSRFPRSR